MGTGVPGHDRREAPANVVRSEFVKFASRLADEGRGLQPTVALSLRERRSYPLAEREGYGYQRINAVPQARPAPKPLSTTRSLALTRPSCTASSRASGTEPAEVLP